MPTKASAALSQPSFRNCLPIGAASTKGRNQMAELTERAARLAIEGVFLRRGLHSEFSMVESQTIKSLLDQYHSERPFTRQEFADCFPESDPRRAAILSGKMDRVAFSELAKPIADAQQLCHEKGCGRPATRTVAGRPVCDDDLHRPPALTGKAQTH